MKKIIYPGIIKNGLLHIVLRKAFDHEVAMFGMIRGEFKDVRVFVSVEKVYKKRSNPQNAYYHGVIVFKFAELYLEQTGEKITSDEAHEMLKAQCNSKEVINQLTGEVRTLPQTTTKLTTVEFEEYLERCRAFILEWFGCVIPLPNEQLSAF